MEPAFTAQHQARHSTKHGAAPTVAQRQHRRLRF